MHPTLHELARAAAPRQHHIAHAPSSPRRGIRARRDAALVHVGELALRVGRQLVAAGGREIRHSGRPPDPRVVA